jgi:hypothetical protein
VEFCPVVLMTQSLTELLTIMDRAGVQV